MLKLNENDIIKRVEILGEAVQTALDAILEIQAEQKLISYLLIKQDEDDDGLA